MHKVQAVTHTNKVIQPEKVLFVVIGATPKALIASGDSGLCWHHGLGSFANYTDACNSRMLQKRAI
jgi:hypothetical protein